MRSNIKLHSCNPELVDIWKDTCIFDLPISLKPTFLNMSLDLNKFQLSDLISQNKFSPSANMENLFGTSLDWNCINGIKINNEEPLFWKWNQLSCIASIGSSVYNYLNGGIFLDESWIGWREIWNLPVIPRIKVHVWKMAHGKLLTNAYLYTLNIGPNTPCNLCGLHPETMDHLFWSFLKILHCWQELFDKLGLNSSMIHLLNSGTRLWQIRDCWAKALIATITWLIWKQHYNLVFRNEPLNPNVIIPRPWSLCVEFSRQSIREYDFL